MGILFYVISVVVGVAIMALILGFWKVSDIKKGKLVVEAGITPKSNKKSVATV
jgi:PTS system fructose-specific IIC component